MYSLVLKHLDINDLRRTRAMFELRLLNNTDCPDEAVRASCAAYETLVVLHNEVEAKRNSSKSKFN